MKDNLLVSASFENSTNNTIKIWNLETGKLIKTIITGLFSFDSIGFLDNGLLVGGISVTNKFYYSSIQLWNLSMGSSRDFNGLWGNIYGLELKDGIIAVCYDSYYDEPSVGLFNVGSNSYVSNWQISPKLFFWKYTKTVLKLSIKGRLITSTYVNTIYVWDIKTKSIIKTLKGHTDSITCLELIEYDNNDNDLLFSGSIDKTIKIWNLNTGEVLQTLVGHSGTVTSLVLVNKSYLISGSEDNSILVWELDFTNNNFKTVGKFFATLTGHSGPITALKISYKGELISASKDSTIKFWNIKTGICLKTLDNIQKIGSVLITNDKILK